MPVSFDDLPDTGGKAAPAAKGPVSFDDLPEARPQSGGGGVGQALESGARALSMGVPFSDRMVAGAKSLPFVGTGKGYSQNLEEERAKRSQLRKEHPVATGLGEAAGGAVSSLALPAVGAGASLGSRVASGVATGGMYGALQGASESPDLTKPKDVLSSASKGAAVGEAIGGAVPLATEAASRVISPLTIPKERQKHLDVLKKEGVDVTAGQASGSRFMQGAEKTLGQMPGGGGLKFEDKQQKQMADAAAKRADMTSGQGLTTERMADRYAQFNQQYTDLVSRNSMPIDQQLLTDIHGALTDYHAETAPQFERPIVADTVSSIRQLRPSIMDGKRYNDFKKRLNDIVERLNMADPSASHALKKIRDAMHAAVGRGLPPGSEDAAIWKQIDRQYANYKVLEDAASKAGQPAAFGRLKPGALRGSLTGSESDRGRYARGEQDLSELEHAANAILQTPNVWAPSSVERLAGLAGLGTAGFHLGGPLGSIAAMATPGAASRAMMSPPAQAYLKNQAGAGLRSPNVTEYNKAGIGALGGALIQPDENSGQ